MATLQLYKTYRFRDKDPVIDQLRTIFDDVGAAFKDVSEGSGVSDTTVRNWFHGTTRRPQHASITAAARALGYDFKLLPSDEFEFHAHEPTTARRERKKLAAQATSTIRRANKRTQRSRRKASGNGHAVART